MVVTIIASLIAFLAMIGMGMRADSIKACYEAAKTNPNVTCNQ